MSSFDSILTQLGSSLSLINTTDISMSMSPIGKQIIEHRNEFITNNFIEKCKNDVAKNEFIKKLEPIIIHKKYKFLLQALKNENSFIELIKIYLTENTKNNIVYKLLSAYIIYKQNGILNSKYSLHLMISDEIITESLQISLKKIIREIDENNLFQEWLIKNISDDDYYNKT